MNKKPMTFLLGCLLTASVAMQAGAQQPIRHELIRGDMPPGEVAHLYQQADPSLIGHMQPVQLIAPTGTTVEIGDAASSFGQAQARQMTVAMGIGFVYRFKLSDLPQPDAIGQSLYPSIEVIGKLKPPAGLENDFPIQVVVTRDDIDLALSGRMVTRVIYLEDPRGTLPHLHTETEQPSVDIRRGQDPLRAAERMGRPMAILRMGSRVPMENEVAEWFTFGVAAPQVLPNPRPANFAGLNDRELEIVESMKRAKAQSAADAKAKAQAEAEEEEEKVESVNKQIEQVRRADFNAGDTDQIELSQTTNEEVIGNAAIDIGTISQTVLTGAREEPDTFTHSEPNWLPVKANAEPNPAYQRQVERPRIKNMIPLPAVPAANMQSNARPPAPSMLTMYFEPLKDNAKEAQPPVARTPIAPPLLAPIRRPNEL